MVSVCCCYRDLYLWEPFVLLDPCSLGTSTQSWHVYRPLEFLHQIRGSNFDHASIDLHQRVLELQLLIKALCTFVIRNAHAYLMSIHVTPRSLKSKTKFHDPLAKARQTHWRIALPPCLQRLHQTRATLFRLNSMIQVVNISL